MKVSSTACVLLPSHLQVAAQESEQKGCVKGTGVALGDFNPGSLENNIFSSQNPIQNQNLGSKVLLSSELFGFVSPREGRRPLPLTDKEARVVHGRSST